MALLHIIHAGIHKPAEEAPFMRLYMLLKFKMKLSYSAWKNKKQLNELIISKLK